MNLLKKMEKIMSDFLDSIKDRIDAVASLTGAAAQREADAVHKEVAAQVAGFQSSITTLQESLKADEGVEASLLADVADTKQAITNILGALLTGNTPLATQLAQQAVGTDETAAAAAAIAGAPADKGTDAGTPGPLPEKTPTGDKTAA